MMTLEEYRQAIPEYAKDLKLNLSNILTTVGLSPAQIYGSALAAALVSENNEFTQVLLEEAGKQMDAAAVTGVKAAAAIMSMNNVYYRFAHTIQDPEIQTMRANLRMNVIGNPGVDKKDFECWSLAASVVNNCGKCINAHADALIKAGMTKQNIQDVARIASVIKAVAAVMKWERA